MDHEAFLKHLKDWTRKISPVRPQDRYNLFIEIYKPDHESLIDEIDFTGSFTAFFNELSSKIFDKDYNLTRVFLTRGVRPRIGSWEALDALIARIPQLAAARKASVSADLPQPAPQMADLFNQPTLYLIYSEPDVLLAETVTNTLAPYGYNCRLHRERRGSPQWHQSVQQDLDRSYAVLTLVGSQTHQDNWVQQEILYAHSKQKPLYALQMNNHPLPPFLPAAAAPIATTENEINLNQLLRQLPDPKTTLTDLTWQTKYPSGQLRGEEVRYMRQLSLDQLQHVTQYYTTLSGRSEIQRSQSGQLIVNSIVARHEFEHAPWLHEQQQMQIETRKFEDAITELKAIQRAVLLGDPGSGKTTTLYKLAADLIDKALPDSKQPIPVMVQLGEWRDASEPFAAFLFRQLGRFHDAFQARLDQNSLFLLLDGLNEIPASQQQDKYRQVNSFVKKHAQLNIIVSCRELDYPPDRRLAMDTVTVSPLDPVRVHEFVHHYLDRDGKTALGDDLFWKLAGEAAQNTFERFTKALAGKLQDPFGTFWLATQLPNHLTCGWDWDEKSKNKNWEDWQKQRTHPANLLLLAFNPYLLFMLVQVYQAYQYTLPTNRGQLFDRFVAQLLVREQLLERDHTGQLVTKPAGEQLLQGLTQIAYQMQASRAKAAAAGGMTTLPADALNKILTEAQQYQAVSCNLLTIGESARFSHQLLQEYFVARAMRERIFMAPHQTKRLNPAAIWPAKTWWQPTNWEEATILLAGLYSDDCTPVVDWLAEAQPELAARCIVESGAFTSEQIKLALRKKWLPRITNLKSDPSPLARAAIGRALGRIALENGEPLDNRRGVGTVVQKGITIPDIVWGKAVPQGRYTIGGDDRAYRSFDQQEITIEKAYKLAVYPITYIQFQCFTEAGDFNDPRWWTGMAEAEEAYGTTYQLKALSEQAFPFHTHPRERVSWYQAIAFCRWLSDKLGYTVDLPHEYEWEVAARYNDGRFYPYGNEFDSKKANTTEGERIDQTSAVGIYPNGRQPVLGLHDLSGNVWEWCRNKYGDADDTAVDQSTARRVVRGGSWGDGQNPARAAARVNSNPADRDDDNGFRVVVRPPS